MQPEEQALIPIEQEEIPFHNQSIVAVRLEDDRVCVVIRWICQSLKINPQPQILRIQRTTSIANELVRVKVQTKGGKQTMPAITLRGFPVWILGLTPTDIKDNDNPEETQRLRDMIIAYQVEAIDVLYNHFSHRRQAVQKTPSSTSITALEQIREMGLAIAHMAEQQIEMEQRLTSRIDATDARLDKAAIFVSEMNRRLTTVEQRTTPASAISESQAAEISTKVKAVAECLSEHDKSKNYYQSIFAELYRRFEVTSYKNIQVGQYQEVSDFLDTWAKKTK